MNPVKLFIFIEKSHRTEEICFCHAVKLAQMDSCPFNEIELKVDVEDTESNCYFYEKEARC